MSENIILPIQVKIIVTDKNNKPAVMLRRLTTDEELIKELIRSAWHETPIVIQPIFPNRIQSLSSLIEKGIIYIKDGQYHFTI